MGATHNNNRSPRKLKIYSYVAGNTLGSHEKILKKLRNKGIKVVTKPEKSCATVVFCPIVSRLETDINSALSNIPEGAARQKVVVVAMHHTFDPNYTLPNCRDLKKDGVILQVHCLFFEKDGLLVCAQNNLAIKRIREELKQIKKTTREEERWKNKEKK